MPPRKQAPQILTFEETVQELVSSLRRTAVKPTIEGYRAQEHQEPFHKSLAKGRGFIGGNRSGKTVAGGAEAVMWLTGRHKYRPTPEPPVRGRAVAIDFDRGVELIVKPEIARWLPPSELIDGSWERSYSKELRTLHLANGSSIEFMSYEQDVEKFAGTSRHFIWFDEEPPEPIFNECLARLIDTGGSYWVTMTPVEGMTWSYDTLYLGAASNPNLDVFEASMEQNRYVNSAEIDIYLSGMTEDEIKARKYGRYVQLGGLVYSKSFDYNKCVIDPILPRLGGTKWSTFSNTRAWAHFRMMDHGYHNPTAWLWACVDSDGRIIVYDEHYVSGEVVSWHANQITERTKLNGAEIEYTVGDPSIANTDPITGTSVQLEYADYGVYIARGNNDVKAGINRVAHLFESGQLLICSNCEKLIWELQRYRWKTWANRKTDFKNNPKDEPAKKDDHACDALRYGIASRFQDEEQPPPVDPIHFGIASLQAVEHLRYAAKYEPDLVIQSILGDDW